MGKSQTKTAEQRTAEAKALQETLAVQVARLVESGEWTRFLAFVGSFHAYSLNNLLLILGQCPHATAVAGFRAWQAKGRQVRKGEKAIKIRGFSTHKVTQTDTETGEETERKLPRFPILSVFDISQTDPIPGAAHEIVQHLTGEDPAGIYAAMAAHLRGQGWTVVREPITGTRNGYTTLDGSRRIVIDSDLSPAQAAKTMLHEAAHGYLHVTPEGTANRDALAHRGIAECEAESVAYVLAGLAGLDTSTYSVGYVASWTDGDLDAVTNTAENVLRAVCALTEGLPTSHGDNPAQTTPGDAQPAA